MGEPAPEDPAAVEAAEGAAFAHRTVMLRECLEALAPRAGGVYADATCGGGGHAEGILEASGPDGRLVAIDRDPSALAASRARLARFGDRVRFVHGEMAELASILEREGALPADGVLADLGVSSPQLDHPERGFSFRHEGALDMRMDPTRGPTAKELIEGLGEGELADLIYQLGEERRSRPIARSIKRAEAEGALSTTSDLRRAVTRAFGPVQAGKGAKGAKGAKGGGRSWSRIDPATRTFQALRIAVNDELGQLRRFLDALPGALAEEGVAAVISFHSLEDRAVKRFFREREELRPLTKRPRIASEEERAENPRARSAKLRAARRVSSVEGRAR